ncbi:MAG: toxin-antitoxin system HicB family antitoxin [Planctomycetota bacterium]
MAKRDSFLIRIDPKILAAVRSWAEDEMRSANGHVEYLLRQALKNAGRLPSKEVEPPASEQDEADSSQSPSDS